MATAQATTDPQLGFPHKGSLKRYPFPRLMREIARGRLTGSLYLLSGQTKKVVFFEEGQPIFVRSNVLAECLGQILSSESLITQEQCEQTLEAIRRTGKKQGELLVEMGILSEGNLRYGLEAQLRSKLFEIFSWEDGRYQFKNDPGNVQFGIRLRLDAEGVIVGAIQDQYSEARANRALRSYDGKFPFAADGVDLDPGALDLLPEETHFVACLDGTRSVADVLAQPPEPAPPTPTALLYGLIQAGLVELSDEALPARQTPEAPDLTPAGGSDEDLAPKFEPQDVVTEYEDTPLPGELPKVRGLLGDHEAAFEEVESEESSITTPPAGGTGPHPRVEVSEDLVAAEPEAQEETFDDDQIELLEDEVEIVDAEDVADIDADLTSSSQELETIEGDDAGIDLGDLDEDLALDGDEPPLLDPVGDDQALSYEEDEPLDASSLIGDEDDDLLLTSDEDPGNLGEDLAAPTTPADGDELVSFDELDDVDLGGSGAQAVAYEGSEATAQEEQDPEMVGAIRFNEAESAMSQGDFGPAVALLEDAYENGFDVAELHAMLAYARFMASGHDSETAQHAFELLDYAENMDPSLDLVHAYRGAIYHALGARDSAREALDRALELNPYCELAMEVMDRISG